MYVKYASRSTTETFRNGFDCTVFEYGGDKDISGAVVVINGRYPESGWAMNEVSEERVYVIQGTGTLYTKATTTSLHETDMALIDTHEPYYFEDTNLSTFTPTTSAWILEQHRQLPL